MRNAKACPECKAFRHGRRSTCSRRGIPKPQGTPQRQMVTEEMDALAIELRKGNEVWTLIQPQLERWLHQTLKDWEIIK